MRSFDSKNSIIQYVAMKDIIVDTSICSLVGLSCLPTVLIMHMGWIASHGSVDVNVCHGRPERSRLLFIVRISSWIQHYSEQCG